MFSSLSVVFSLDILWSISSVLTFFVCTSFVILKVYWFQKRFFLGFALNYWHFVNTFCIVDAIFSIVTVFSCTSITNYEPVFFARRVSDGSLAFLDRSGKLLPTLKRLSFENVETWRTFFLNICLVFSLFSVFRDISALTQIVLSRSVIRMFIAVSNFFLKWCIGW